MDKFIVSARKYRPQTFDTVVGQLHITTTLRNAIKNQQLAHAFLFCGPRGVGKTTCARILAKTINCENQSADGEACNTCNSCVSFNEGTSMNIHELDAASNNSVDDIRSLVDQVRFAPQAGKYKVYIIDEVHMLSSSAFNAFLKTLEEPPPYAIFILATTEKHKILPTILSRCQIFDFKRITTNDTVMHLQEICEKEHIKADKSALQVIAQKSEGCMRDSLSIMDKIVSFTNGEVNYANTLEHLNILDADYFFKLLDSMQQQDLAGALLLFEDINRKGFEGDMLLNGFAEFIRNLLVSKDPKVAGLLDVVEGFREKYIETAQKVNGSWLLSALNILNDSEIQYKMARNKRLHVELALIKLTYLNQAIEVSSGEEAGAKKKLKPETKALAFRKIAPVAYSPKQATGTTPSKAAAKEGAKLIIETPVVQEKIVTETVPEKIVPHPTPKATTEKKPEAGTGKISMLESIRKQYAGKNINAERDGIIPLTEELLKEQWEKFSQTLRDTKNPAIQSFVMARLRITSPGSFEVICNNNLEQKFIEQERNKLNEYLQLAFKNKLLQYAILIEEAEEEIVETERPLNTREQFQKIAEEYPLVKELKDRLRLELDY
ncbi:MAG: DNA polymerase III subunit gamma/tau [Chitinophagaceae bacterium]|nr:DNA polymerase III subunit gamma/tau [Chitinophagaceae bacterium]